MRLLAALLVALGQPGVHVGAQPTGLAYGAGSLWSANSGSGTVSRVDVVHRRVVRTIRVGVQPAAVETAAYFVISEALTNVAKYAHAGHATVRMERHDGRLVLEVSDDGVGGASPGGGSGLRGLADRVAQHLLDEWDIEVVPLEPAQLNGSRGEINAHSGILSYDRTLAPSDKLELFAHELGHLVLHRRLTDPTMPRDPVLGSAYADVGPGAIARYSHRGAEEAQATAFATEFVCPSGDVFAAWRANSSAR